MSVARLDDLLSRARSLSGEMKDAAPEERQAQLASIAAEFESMLMSQMLGAMRQSAKWGGEEQEDGLGGEAFFGIIDTALVQQLARGGGLGAGAELRKSLERAYTARTGGAGLPAVTAAPLGFDPSLTTVDPVAVDRQTTSAFGWRQDPIRGGSRFHKGIDLAAAYGDEVRSAAAGRVVFSGQQNGYGVTVVVEHPGGARSRYAHLSAAEVRVGDAVGAGAPVGRAGATGRATGPHVHFEVTVNGQHVDPGAWLRGQAAGFKPAALRADSSKGPSISSGAQE